MKRSESYYKEKYKRKYKMNTKEMVIKTLILRVISSVVTAGLVYFFTGSWTTSTNILWIDFLLKTILYYIYEYEWFRFRKLWYKNLK